MDDGDAGDAPASAPTRAPEMNIASGDAAGFISFFRRLPPAPGTLRIFDRCGAGGFVMVPRCRAAFRGRLERVERGGVGMR